MRKMCKGRASLWFIVFSLLIISVALLAQASARYAIVISIDGLPMDYLLYKNEYGLKIPHLTELMQRGSYACGTISVFPSVTFPSHTTMVTGVRPARHQIFSNAMFDPAAPGRRYWEAEHIKAKTLWDAAHEKGLKTAAIFWPVTLGAKIDYLIPEYRIVTQSHEEHRNGMAQVSTPGLIDAVEKAYRKFEFPSMLSDEDRTNALCYVLREKKPNLSLLHITRLDSTQHSNGRNTEQAYRVLEEMDGLVGKVINAAKDGNIYDSAAFFIVSDHGFISVNKQFNVNVALKEAGLIETDAQGKVVNWRAYAHSSGGAAAIILRDSNDRETAMKVKRLIARLAANPSHGIAFVFDEADIARIGGDTRAVLMLSAAYGFSFGDGLSADLQLITESRYRGTHGYYPEMMPLRATFIASGYGIKSGLVLPEIEMVQIAPTIARYLGLDLPGAEDKPITEILK